MGHFPTGYISEFPIDVDSVTCANPPSNPGGTRCLQSSSGSWAPGSLWDPPSVATAPFRPSAGPCPSNECFPSCVSTSRQPSVWPPGRLKGHGAGSAGARVYPMTIVFAKHQIPFLTSICCLDTVRTHGNKRPAARCTSFFWGCSAVFVTLSGL